MSDQNEYPLYPELRPGAAQEAQRLMDGFKADMLKLCESTLSDLYCEVAAYIESDSWINFRNDLLTGLTNYPNSKIQGEYDFKKIRQAILREHRSEIVADLNKDLVQENEALKAEIQELHEAMRRRSGF